MNEERHMKWKERERNVKNRKTRKIQRTKQGKAC
jgi:hypothetical protein